MSAIEAGFHTHTATTVYDAVTAWRSLVIDAEARGTGAGASALRALGRRGTMLVGGTDRWTESSFDPVSRDDCDPVLLQLINRVLWRCWNPRSAGGYASIVELRIDMDRLSLYLRVPASRRPLLAELERLLDEATEGRPGSRLVVGEPGIGKSYLWHLVVSRAAQRTQVRAYYKARQTGATPFEGLFGVLRSVTSALAPDAIDAALDDASASDSTRDLVGRLRSGSDARAGRAPSVPAAKPSPSELAAVFAALIDRTPSTVVCIDDIQWLDAESLSVVIRLSDSLPNHLVLVLMGRPEAGSRIPGATRTDVRTVEPLTRAERADLLESLMILPGRALGASREIIDWVEGRSGGNPMAIVDTVRSLDQTKGILAVPDSCETSESRPVYLEALARSALERLEPGPRQFVELLSLLLPPVSFGLLRDYEDDLDAAAGAFLVQTDPDGRVAFRHDSIESAARSLAIGNAATVTSAVRVLLETVESGDRRVALALARSLIGLREAATDGVVPPVIMSAIPQDRVIPVLRDAADFALDLVLPMDALAFCDHALSHQCAGDTRIDLHRIGHEAAFLTDDAYAMSRHFDGIKSGGDALAINQARQLWITRSYAKLAIRGALRIGSMVLRELDVHPDAWQHGSKCRLSRDYLASRRPASLLRRIEDRPPTTDPFAHLIGTTCSRLLLPVLTLDPNRLAAMARVILEQAERRGPTGYEPVGFIYWRLLVGSDGGPIRDRFRLARMALRLLPSPAVARLDRPTRHWIETFTTFFGIEWENEHREKVPILHRAYEEGMRIGSFEAAANAIHLGCQILLYHGDPLAEVYETMDSYRRIIARIGHGRTATALSKHQQAAECLLGRTADPLVLTGSICDEDQLMRRNAEAEDLLSQLGTTRLKAILAVYGDEPVSAAACCRATFERERVANSVVDSTLVYFLWGMVAWRADTPEDGMLALGLLRPWRRTIPGRHRYHAVRAERLVARGRSAAALRSYSRAYRAALAAEYPYPHEAALIAERQGDALRATGADRPSIVDAYLRAQGLYDRWGATPSVVRMRRKLADVDRRGPDLSGSEPGPAMPAVRSAAQDDELHRLGHADAGLHPDEALAESGPATLESMRRIVLNAQSNLHLLFTTLSDAILLVDESMKVMYHNPSAEAYVEPDQSGLSRIRRPVASALATTIHACMMDGIGREQELVIDGRTLRVTVNPAPSAARAARTIIALSVRDVTDIRDQERQLIIADRLASLGMLASTIAHEVGNPNHVIGLAGQTLQVLLSRLNQADAARAILTESERALDQIMEGARRVDDVIRQVKEYGRGGTEERWERADPVDLCDRVLRFSRILATHYTDRLLYEPGSDVPPVLVVRDLVEQALINLIRNACEAISDRSARIVVSTRHDRANQSVVFAVSDEGPGIAAAFASGSGRAFLTGRADDGGTGLGLSIVRSIARKHGGQLRFRSDDRYATIAELIVPSERSTQPTKESGDNDA
jgi:signal transduction histidine kinase